MHKDTSALRAETHNTIVVHHSRFKVEQVIFYKWWEVESCRTQVHPGKKKKIICMWWRKLLISLQSEWNVLRQRSRVQVGFLSVLAAVYLSLSFVCTACILSVLICICLAGGFSLLGSELQLRCTFTWIRTEPSSHSNANVSFCTLLFSVCQLWSPVHWAAEKEDFITQSHTPTQKVPKSCTYNISDIQLWNWGYSFGVRLICHWFNFIRPITSETCLSTRSSVPT